MRETKKLKFFKAKFRVSKPKCPLAQIRKAELLGTSPQNTYTAFDERVPLAY
jgi:hypothetical protein